MSDQIENTNEILLRQVHPDFIDADGIPEILQDPQKKRELIEGVVEFFKRCRHWF